MILLSNVRTAVQIILKIRSSVRRFEQMIFNTKCTSIMLQNHQQKPLKDQGKTHMKLLTKWNNCLLIFVDFSHISLLIINSWYIHCFEHAHHGRFMGSLLLNGIKVGFFFGKKHLCRHDKNYSYFWKSNISVINLIVDSRKYDQSFKKYKFVKN